MMIQSELEAILDPLIQELGCCLWAIEYRTQEHTPLLRIYVDKPGGVTLSDCEKVSRQVGALLDVEGRFSGRYRLEVSSPGVPRSLFKPSQYKAYVGKQVQLRLNQMMDGTRKITGLIEAVSDEQLKVKVAESLMEIPFYQIVKAHLID